jgi:hypothetical protein
VCAPPIMLSFSLSVRTVRNIIDAPLAGCSRGWRSTRRVQTLSACDRRQPDREDYYEVANERGERAREEEMYDINKG